MVWDVSEKIIQQKPHYSKVIEKWKHALSLALTIHDKERIEKLNKTIINYEEKIAEDDKPGLWGFSYELLIKIKKFD